MLPWKLNIALSLLLWYIYSYVADNNVGHSWVFFIKCQFEQNLAFLDKFSRMFPPQNFTAICPVGRKKFTDTPLDYAITPANWWCLHAPQCTHTRLLLNIQCARTHTHTQHYWHSKPILGFVVVSGWPLTPTDDCSATTCSRWGAQRNISCSASNIWKRKTISCTHSMYSMFRDKLRNCSRSQSE